MMPAVATDTVGGRDGASVVSHGFLWPRLLSAGNDNQYYITGH